MGLIPIEHCGLARISPAGLQQRSAYRAQVLDLGMDVNVVRMAAETTDESVFTSVLTLLKGATFARSPTRSRPMMTACAPIVTSSPRVKQSAESVSPICSIHIAIPNNVSPDPALPRKTTPAGWESRTPGPMQLDAGKQTLCNRKFSLAKIAANVFQLFAQR